MAIGGHGQIRLSLQSTGLKAGQWRATAKYRDQSGEVKQLSYFRPTKTAAREALEARIDELATQAVAAGGITPETTLRELADHFIEGVRVDGHLKPQTIADYRWHLDRYVLAPGMLANVRIREASTGRLETHVRKIARHHPATAKKIRGLLLQLMSLAARHDAVLHNTARETSTVRQAKSNKRILIVDEENGINEVMDLLDQIQAWQRGEEIPGRSEAPKGGQSRNSSIADYVTLYLATACRTAELLGIRWKDVDLKSDPATVTITGTVVNKSKAEGGLQWQPEPKTEAGYRVVTLAPSARDVLWRRFMAAKKGEEFVFSSQVGGLVSPANMRRAFRDARGEGSGSFEWVTPRVLRKTALTRVGEKMGDRAAARQAGHSDDGEVYRKHYRGGPIEAPDTSNVLEEMFHREVT